VSQVSEQHRFDPREIAGRLGHARPPEILDATATAIARGHHVAVLAAEGSGREAAYALAVLERCDAGEAGLQALLLTATDERADRLGRALHLACAPEGLPVFVPGRGWSDAEGVPARSRVVAGRPSRLLPAIRSGRLGLGSLRLLVLDGVSTMVSLDEWSSAEPLLDGLDADTQRIAASEVVDAVFAELVERRLPRARRWPEELFPAAGAEKAPAPAGGAPLRIGLASGERALELVARCAAEALREGDGAVGIACASPEDVPRIVAELGVRGHEASVEDDRVRIGDDDGAGAVPAEAAAILYGLPSGLPELERALGAAARRYAVVEPRHFAQLRLLAARARLSPELLPQASVPDELDAVALYRQRLREAVRSADVVPELLVLEPLLEEFGAMRVAAALSERLRLHDEEAGIVLSWPDVEAASLPGSRPAPSRRREKTGGEESRPAPRGARPAWSRLFIGIGRRDEVRPSDLVGALTGEAGIAGGQIGKIEIRGSFSVAEIDSQAVDQVIRRMQGVTIRGQPVSVRLDRGG
jgi:ATP-dependent RNA helicase DeaD